MNKIIIASILALGILGCASNGDINKLQTQITELNTKVEQNNETAQACCQQNKVALDKMYQRLIGK